MPVKLMPPYICIQNLVMLYSEKSGSQPAIMFKRQIKNFADYLKNPIPHSMFLAPIESHDILSVTSKLKSKLSSGHDNILTKFLQDTIQSIHRPLTYLINQSFAKGVVPNQLKLAKVIPIHKSSDKSQ